MLLQESHEMLVFDVVGRVMRDVRQAVLTPGKNGVMCHQQRDEAEVERISNVVADDFGHPFKMEVELSAEPVVKVRPWSPDETNAQFPSRLGYPMKVGQVDS